MKNPRVSRRKEILKIRAEINAKETKGTIAKINYEYFIPIKTTDYCRKQKRVTSKIMNQDFFLVS